MDRLEHIHAALAAALRTQRPETPFEAPVTVAEIYQDLVPYRAVRTQLGFDMNADYEHTLLRLLAGEEGLARLDPVEARDELRKELGTANPNVGLFRKFAACDVWISKPGPNAPVVNVREVPSPFEASVPPLPGLSDPEPERADAMSDAALATEPDREAEGPVVDAPEPDGASETDAWAARSALWMDPSAEPVESEAEMELPELQEDGFELLLEDAVEGGEAEEATPTPSAAQAATPTPTKEPAVATTVKAGSERAAPSTGACPFCDSALPSGRAARFCPFCGMDQSLLPCGSCSEPLEADWRFCIACGADGPGVAAG
jgi:hypothetical protein